uniref:NADH dehydrogenase subunit 6 n=1 Tax=Phascolosoma sp. f LL-2023 TaxID=3082417 RepID=A0AA96YJE6_9ANNE|nr:NADH dehydrogenase subunit 6 [Phascolosoma sp. f LL-2023]
MFFSFSLALFLALVVSLPLTASPLTLGLWVLCLSMSTALLLSLSLCSWASLILVLVYIGGLNVLFAYFIATLPNYHLFFKPLAIAFTTALLTFWTNYQFFPSSLIQSPHQTIYITMMMCNTNMYIFLLIALILFLALIAVVKIASRHSGPLRPFLLK